jgi:hypothetical protein
LNLVSLVPIFNLEVCSKASNFIKGITMRIKALLGASALAVMVAFSAPAFAADEFSMHEVYQAAQAGHINEAQAMMDKVLRDHPDNAKAHYVESELLAKQGKMSAAAAELSKAEQLKPGLPFAKPESVQELKAVIAGHRAPMRAEQGGISWGVVLLVLALIVFIYFVGRAMGRRNNPVVYPAGNYGNGPYGQAPYGGAPYGGAPMGGPVGGGMGSGIMGGLATGAALGAGMVAGEALMHNLTDGGSHQNNGMIGEANAADSWDTPNDMGGNDFGVTDGGSWDDGGGGDWT